MPSTSSAWPEVSTWPPLPPVAPPRAVTRPLAVVTLSALCTSLHSTTRPPSPARVALASMCAPAAMVTVVAAGVGCAVAASSGSALPCQPPPTRTLPPPWAPLASMRLPSVSTICSPCRLTWPP